MMLCSLIVPALLKFILDVNIEKYSFIILISFCKSLLFSSFDSLFKKYFFSDIKFIFIFGKIFSLLTIGEA